MGKSKHRKDHKEKLNTYKANKKKEQELFKKKMIDQYIKMQQENLQNQEAHSSVEEVSGPEINVDDLNLVNDSNVIRNEFETMSLDDIIIEDAEIIETELSEIVDEKPEEIV